MLHWLIKKNIKNLIMLICLFLITLIVVGCKAAPQQYEDTRFILGTALSIKAYGEEAEIAVLNGFKQIEELEPKFDQYKQNSEISRLNDYFDKQAKDTIKISPELCQLIALGVEYGEKTGGKYDISIGPLVELWGAKEKDNLLPLQSEINQVKSLIDYKKIVLDCEENTFFMEKGMILDLSSIAKGYLAQQAIVAMEKYNINGAIINAGGNVVTMGNNLDSKWKIGLANPQEPDSLIGYLSFTGDKAVVSSGNYQQYYLIEGERYGHILNVETGLPCNQVLGVTVMGVDSAVADVLSTAAFVVAIEEGLDLIQNAGYEGLIIDNSGQVHKTAGLEEYFHKS